MNCITKNVVNKKLFFKAITTDLADSMKIFPGKLPIIHISAHGNKNGIATTSSDDIITWDLFHEMLTYINIFFQGNLILCMSSCEGLYAYKMVCRKIKNKNEMPFFAIIGNSGKPLWSETAIAFATFYHQINKGQSLTEAVRTACIASGNNSFRIIFAKEVHDAYIESIKKLKIEEIRKRLKEGLPVNGLFSDLIKEAL